MIKIDAILPYSLVQWANLPWFLILDLLPRSQGDISPHSPQEYTESTICRLEPRVGHKFPVFLSPLIITPSPREPGRKGGALKCRSLNGEKERTCGDNPLLRVVLVGVYLCSGKVVAKSAGNCPSMRISEVYFDTPKNTIISHRLLRRGIHDFEHFCRSF
jgi:hypothetical protein